MVEPRNDMFPDESQTISDVTIDVPIEVKAPIIEDEKVPESVPTPVKTPSNELLAALKEERAKRKGAEADKTALEQKLKELESSSQSFDLDDESLSEEGKVLKRQIESLQGQLGSVTENLEKERVFAVFPQLKEKASEFDTFKADYPGVPMEKIAKLYLAENDLLYPQKPRKGLERPTGGAKVAEPSGTSAAEIDRLMKNEPKKFERMLRSGEIDVNRIY